MLNRISRSNKFSLIFTPFLFLTQPTLAAWYDINMTKGVTAVSNEVFDLHMLIFWVCVVIGIVVFGVMFYSMFAHGLNNVRGHPDRHHGLDLVTESLC